jgi:hypothetical protein
MVHPQIAQLVQEFDAIDDAPGKPVQSVDKKPVDFSISDLCKKTLKRRPVQRGARPAFIIEMFLDPAPAVVLVCPDKCFAGFELDLSTGKVRAGVAGLAGVNGANGESFHTFCLD